MVITSIEKAHLAKKSIEIGRVDNVDKVACDRIEM